MKEKNALAMYKIKLNELLENDCQCPICNEVIFKVCFIHLILFIYVLENLIYFALYFIRLI